jgi:hypothetical protein
MRIRQLAFGLPSSTATVLFTLLLWPSAAGAANGQRCAGTSKLRGQFCNSPPAGLANRAQCLAGYNWCLNALPRLMHQWCVQIDQPNCNRNDDCPGQSSCYVHPLNQRRWTDLQCHLGAKNKWHFELFDVADCKCDCTNAAFPLPPEGPEAITMACGDRSVDCSRCSEPAEGEQICVGPIVPWEQPAEGSQTTAPPAKTPASRNPGCGGCMGSSANGTGALALLALLGLVYRRR